MYLCLLVGKKLPGISVAMVESVGNVKRSVRNRAVIFSSSSVWTRLKERIRRETEMTDQLPEIFTDDFDLLTLHFSSAET